MYFRIRHKSSELDTNLCVAICVAKATKALGYVFY